MNDLTTPPRLGRRIVASLWAAAAIPYVLLGVWALAARALGVFDSVPAPAVAVIGVIAGLGLVAASPRVASLLPQSLDGWLDVGNRKLAALWAAGGALAVFLLVRIAVFLADPSYVSCSIVPSDAFLVHHSCLTAYMHGAILVQDPAANVYDMAFVPIVAGVPAPLPATAAHFAPFALDAFGYPPPFLLLPRALLSVTTSFPSQRMLCGAASLLLLLFACAAAARTIGGVAERRIWLLAPLFAAHPLVLVTLQVGNFHVAALALCLLCWVTLERRQDGLTGALLAIATLAKIFPGLLGVLLLMQRRWRAAAFTCVVAVAVSALSVAVLGTKVWKDFFFYHLPHVESGEALRFMAGSTREIAFNFAPFGIPIKLGALGLDGWGWRQAPAFGNVFTLVLLVVAVAAGRRSGSPQRRLSVWLGVLMLASLRSPYAAPFVLSTMVVLVMVLAAEVGTRRHLVGLVVFLASFSVPLPDVGPAIEIVVSMVRQLVAYAFLFWVVLRTPTLGGGLEIDPVADRAG